MNLIPLHYLIRLSCIVLAAGLLSVAMPSRVTAASKDTYRETVAGMAAEEALRLGERIYREGILPSGEVMQGFRGVNGKAGSVSSPCVKCHLRSGLGSIKGGDAVPPVTGRMLYQPYVKGTLFTQTIKPAKSQFVINRARRQAYTDETLAEALRTGINPDGIPLNEVMPHYNLTDKEVKVLTYYLKSLSYDPSPGVDSKTLRLATIITDKVSAEDRRAMLAPLEEFIALRNSQAKIFEVRARYMGMWGMAGAADLAYRMLSLAVWELQGPPEKWRSQLAEHYRQEPVFALVGGISSGTWQPVHSFCEEEKIPCLFPVTDLPVVSATDWYTIYFNKGFQQEGEAAAHFLNSSGIPQQAAVVQIMQESAEGDALATGFQKAWQEGLGRNPPETIVLKKQEPLSQGLLQQAVDSYKPSVLLLWINGESLPVLERIAAAADRPKLVVASSGLMQKDIWRLSDKARELTYFTYPFRLPRDEDKFNSTASLKITRPLYQENGKRISTRVYSMLQILQLGMLHMENNFYRDYLLDILSQIPDQILPDYERLTFNGEERYAAKDCNIVQLTAGTRPELVKKSDFEEY